MSINKIKEFWEKNPLYYGEVNFELGTIEYFENIKKIFVYDLFPGEVDKKILPKDISNKKLLDLGTGPGLYTRFFYENGCRDLYSADLTQASCDLVKKMCDIYNFKNVKISQQNAEKTSFKNNYFDHVHCSGVIHHTEHPNKCYDEIFRILKEDGTAVIGVYYMNFILRNWNWIKYIVKTFKLLQPNLKGRKRSKIFLLDDYKEVVRYFDGEDNPKGIAYTKKEILDILKENFIIEKTYLHYFPLRTLRFKLPRFIHKFLDEQLGFMIYLNVKKKVKKIV